MWFSILFIMIFIYIGLGIVQRIIDIFKFFIQFYANKECSKKKLIK